MITEVHMIPGARLSMLFLVITQLPTSRLIAQDQPLDEAYKDSLVRSIERLVSDNYVLRNLRDSIASELHLRNSNGAYDDSHDFEDLAARLTDDLQAISGDRHFLIVYDPEAAAELRVEEGEDAEGAEEAERIANRKLVRERRANFWFRRVEILDGNIGYLDLRRFSGSSAAYATAHAAVEFLAHSDAIIIDLRHNVGGSASMFVLLASYFFGDSPVHLGDIYNGISDETREIWTRPDLPLHTLPDIDLYVLTSGETFSAAEEFAYDFKHLDRAIIVGESTGGGAHMATKMELNDDYYMYLPFAGAVNPITGSNWEGIGVLPDVEVPSDDALDAAHIMIIERKLTDESDQERKNELETLLAELTAGIE